MKPESKKWVEAAIILGRDPTAKVRCPVCDQAFLTVRDVFPSPDSSMFERYLECPNCKSRNIMRMTRPASPQVGGDSAQAKPK
jgi:hypothetical protein